jgi:SAM-dependent methyltransferase
MTEYDALADLYDAEWQELTTDIPFLAETARQYGGPALDLAAGTGRVTFPIAETGLEVVAMDNSASMLQRGEEALAGQDAAIRERVTFMTGDMARFQIGRQFRFICISQNSFLLLADRKDQEQCLRCIYDHLDPEGRFVVDIYSPRFDLIGQKENDIQFLRHFFLPEQQAVVMQWEYAVRNMAAQTMDIDFLYEVYDKQGQLTRRTHQLHMAIVFRYEMQYLLEKHGFVVETVYGDYDKTIFGPDSPQMIFLCKKGTSRVS